MVNNLAYTVLWAISMLALLKGNAGFKIYMLHPIVLQI